MALAHEPDFAGFADEYEPLLVPRWTEMKPSPFAAAVGQPQMRSVEKPAARSIYDMPINPLPAPAIRYEMPPSPQGAIVLPFVRPQVQVEDHSPIDYRPAWVAGAFLAASVCAAVTVGSSWFEVPPESATSTAQLLASQVTALIGVTGIAALAAVISTALLLVGAQRAEHR